MQMIASAYLAPALAALTLVLFASPGCQEIGRGDPGLATDGGPDEDAERATSGSKKPGPAPFSFVVIGDTQAPNNDCAAGGPELAAFPVVVRSLSPTFVLHLGDLVDRGQDDDAFSRFLSCYRPLIDHVPLFPTLGNHDLDDGGTGGANYRRYLEEQLFLWNPAASPLDFDLDYGAAGYMPPDRDHLLDPEDVPSGQTHGTFYTFRHRNAFFVSFEQGADWELNTPRSWVEEQLKRARADRSIAHVIVYLHHPVYSVFQPESEMRWIRTTYEPLFRQYDVTLVFSGHSHVYDRQYVPDDGSSTAAHPPSVYDHDGAGIHYITTGPAGASFIPETCAPGPDERKDPSILYHQAHGCGHNLTRVEVMGRTLRVSVLGVEVSERKKLSTTVWDRFTIR